MVMATSGLIPELFAVLESKTAQRQLGFWPMLFAWRQQVLETAAFTSTAASAQGASLKASLSGVDFPHGLVAPSTFSRTVVQTNRSKPRTKTNFIGASIPVCHKLRIHNTKFSSTLTVQWNSASPWPLLYFKHELKKCHFHSST